MSTVLGVSALFHDSAACILTNDTILGAAQEERFTRVKGDASFPKNAIRYCVDNIPAELGLDAIAYFENPKTKMDRIVKNAFDQFPSGAPMWKQSLRTLKELNESLPLLLCEIIDDPKKIYFVGHHRSHAASAYYPSQFDEAAVLVVDGVGEWSTTSIWLGRGDDLTPISEVTFPHSIGLLYSAFTQYCGFKVNSGEYKLMGLAPFGEPVFVNKILDELIDLRPDGSFKLNLKYFDFHRGLNSISPLFGMLFGKHQRFPEEPITRHFMNVAASIQVVTNLIMQTLAQSALKITGAGNLCMAGGVALNCVANNAILSDLSDSSKLWIQPAAGDAGGALGAALVVQRKLNPGKSKTKKVPQRNSISMRGSYLGPEYDAGHIEEALQTSELLFTKFESETDLLDCLVENLIAGKIVGHFDGRMEFGPRALGNRSILADPRPENMLKRVNLGIKFREGWRPFAPMMLADKVEEYYEDPVISPYMLLTSKLKKQLRKGAGLKDLRSQGIDSLVDLQVKANSGLSAVTHVDFSSRLQTVVESNDTRAFQLLTKFYNATGCPALLNTSFNVRGEPIVCSPDDAISCFLNTHMDVVVIGSYVVFKDGQPAWVRQKVGRKKFDAD